MLLLGGMSVGVVAVLDREPGRRSAPAAEIGTPAEITAPGSGRVFILFIDSWRYQAVTDPRVMPSVAKLREKATFAEVETVHDAITVPAIRAAFSGHHHFQVLGFVQNFISATPGIESLFSQLKSRGDSLSIYSDHKTFHQFGADTAGIRSFDTEDAITGESQVRQARAVFREFCEGRDRLAVYHVVFLDYMAHAVGVHHRQYAAVSRMVDELITDLAAGLRANDTLIVFGDHGHDEKGRHIVGLDIPTAFLAIGPGFRSGVDLGRIHITAYRYLIGWALRLPLARDYGAGRYPEALVAAPGPAPAGYFEPGSAADGKHRTGRHPWWIYVSLASGVAASAAVWLVCRGKLCIDASGESWLRSAVIATAAMMVFVGVGVALAKLRPLVHEPDYETLRNLWIAGFAVLLALQWRLGVAMTGWIALAAPFLFLWPTTYRYGAPGTVIPAWLCWVTVAFAAWFRFRDRQTEVGWRVLPVVLSFVAIAYFLQAFFFTEAFTFEFTHWIPLSYTLRPYSKEGMAVAGAAAALIVVFRRSRHWSAILMPVLFAAYVSGVFLGIPPASPIHLAVALGSLGTAFALNGWSSRQRQARALVTVACCIIGLFAAFFYSVRLGSEIYLYALFVAAALRLSAVLVRQLPSPERQDGSHALLLMVFGSVASLWATTGWGMRKLEWGFLYDFLPASMVENYVGLFLPLIALKLCVPALIGRAIISDELHDVPFPAEGATMAAGVKVLSLVAISIGVHLVAPSTDLYIEAVEEIAFVLVLCFAFFPAPRRRRKEAAQSGASALRHPATRKPAFG